MVPSKFGNWIVILTVIAMIVAAYSFSQSWYRMSDPSGASGAGFFVNMHSIDREPGGAEATFFDPVRDLMTWVQDFIILWFVFAFAFFGSMLIDKRNLSMITGLGSVAMGILVLAYLALGMDDAIRHTSGWAAEWPHGFTGSVTVDNEMRYTWGPLGGWWTMLGACAIQTFGVGIRSSVILRDR